ncbi:hypothetical protein GCM10009744_59370 [Kribbella alba]|uniref:Uncharacterized protein n=1 Tax=Kribbella alba TaxID=190197 RepID=A0ABN2FSL0_9ACTN
MDTLTEKPRRRVCVWFGEHKIVEHVSEPAFAAPSEATMRRRFASCLARTGVPADQLEQRSGPQQPQGCLGRGWRAVADFTTATNQELRSDTSMSTS